MHLALAPGLLCLAVVRLRLRLLGLVLLLPALLGRVEAAPRSPRTDPAFEGWKRGGLSEVYVHRQAGQVVKLIGSRALPKADWVQYPRWLTRSRGRVSPAARAHLTTQAMAAYDRLRADPRFAARYGHLLPRTTSPAPGRIDQQLVEGVDFDALAPAARRRAGAQMRQILSLAREVLRGEVVDHNKYNFVFDPSGRVVGWVDWVIGRVPGRLL